MEKLAWLHVIIGSSSYLLITLLAKYKVFVQRRSIFFSFAMGNNIALVVCTIVMLPQTVEFPNLASQIAFGGSVLFLKCFVFFHAQSTGKLFLIFNTVSFDNATFVDAFCWQFDKIFYFLFLLVSCVFWSTDCISRCNVGLVLVIPTECSLETHS